MKAIFVLSFFLLLVSCAKNSSDGANPSQSQVPQGSKGQRESLPDMIHCGQQGSLYELVLALRNQQLPKDVTAVALKKNQLVIFKIATQVYQDSNGLLSFVEIPAGAHSKEAKLNLETKEATLSNFRADDLTEGSIFNCQF